MTYKDFSVMGIDISSDLDVSRWDSLWKISTQFAMIRATIGMEKDPKFDEYMKELDNGCVRVGVYHSLRTKAINKAQEETRYFLRQIQGYKYRINFFVGVWVDADLWGLNNENLCTGINVAAALIREAGYIPIVYTDSICCRYLTKYNIPLWVRVEKPVEKLTKHELKSVAIVQENDKAIMAYNSARCGRNFLVNQNIFEELRKKYVPKKTKKDTYLYMNLFNRQHLPIPAREQKNHTKSREWAIKEGIVFPDEKGSYGFEKECSRQEFLTLMNRMYRLWRLYYGHD